jgi:hypothetical protein
MLHVNTCVCAERSGQAQIGLICVFDRLCDHGQRVEHIGGYRLSSDALHKLQSVTKKRWSLLLPRSLNRGARWR